MSKARLVITAIEVEGRTPAADIADYGVSRSWLYTLLARYRAEGDAAIEPRTRRPHTSPAATPDTTIELVLLVGKQLSEVGLEIGPLIGVVGQTRATLGASRAPCGACRTQEMAT